jgi:rSAM/selenodomain-associated transferase 2
MNISIIIPVINEAPSISSAIERAWAAGADEVIVVDGGSDDATVEIANGGHCQIVTGPPGRGSQMNRGASVAGAKHLLLFLHADCWLETGVCDQIRSAAQHENFWGGFHQRIENPAAKYRWLERGNAARVRWQGLVYGDQGMFVSAELFHQVGGFPAQPLMEDFDISRRLTRIVSPALLPGPIHVSARRWKENGVLRQTFRNWTLSTAYRCGVSAERLSHRYRRHDG